MAPSLHTSDLTMLEDTVQKWLVNFHQMFPNFVMKPKFHYLLHYADCIRMHGPPVKYATIRFEAKHAELKKHLKSSKNTRNVCKTMAESYQLAICNRDAGPSEVPCSKKNCDCIRLGDFSYSAGDVVLTRHQSVRYMKISHFTKQDSGYTIVGHELLHVLLHPQLAVFSVTGVRPERRAGTGDPRLLRSFFSDFLLFLISVLVKSDICVFPIFWCNFLLHFKDCE